MSILFSLIEFAENKSNTRYHFLIIDELIDNLNLDASGKDLLLQCMKYNIKKKLIIISHDGSIQHHFNKHYRTEIKGGFSNLIKVS
jgi:DNA repair exonuclease SbcCD ATPase subunit